MTAPERLTFSTRTPNTPSTKPGDMIKVSGEPYRVLRITVTKVEPTLVDFGDGTKMLVDRNVEYELERIGPA